MIPRKPLRPVFATLNQDKNINKAPSTTETEMIFRAIVSVSKKNLSLMVDQKNTSIKLNLQSKPNINKHSLIKILNNDNFDIIILDLIMPVIDGFQIIEFFTF